MVSPDFGRVEEEEKNRSAEMEIIPIGICAGPVGTVMDWRQQEADVIILLSLATAEDVGLRSVMCTKKVKKQRRKKQCVCARCKNGMGGQRT